MQSRVHVVICFQVLVHTSSTALKRRLTQCRRRCCFVTVGDFRCLQDNQARWPSRPHFFLPRICGDVCGLLRQQPRPDIRQRNASRLLLSLATIRLQNTGCRIARCSDVRCGRVSARFAAAEIQVGEAHNFIVCAFVAVCCSVLCSFDVVLVVLIIRSSISCTTTASIPHAYRPKVTRSRRHLERHDRSCSARSYRCGRCSSGQ
jgi:hypothetical protein